MEGEQEPPRGELVQRVRTCPACEADDARLIEFGGGRVFRCDRCGLLELERDEAGSQVTT